MESPKAAVKKTLVIQTDSSVASKGKAAAHVSADGKKPKQLSKAAIEKGKSHEKPIGLVAKAALANAAAAEKNAGGKKKGRSVAEAASNVTADSKGYVFINGRRVRMISPKNQKPGKKIRNNGSPSGEAEAAEKISIRSIKTKPDRKQLNYYRDLLLQKRREIIGDLNAMETEALRSGSGNLSHMPIHMADVGTDTNDQDLMLGLAETERKQLREVDSALQRIEDRTYGVCQHTGESIPKARLEAKPWAKYTVEAARMLEGQWGSA